MKLWFRFLFRRLTYTFLFFLFSLFFLYVAVDLSVNGVRFFTSEKTLAAEIALYYLQNFAEHLDLFLPLSFLLSAMKVLLDLNAHRELGALQMAGLSKKKLLSPFFLFASLLSAACYINSEWIAPDAQGAADRFRMGHAKKKKMKRVHVFTLSLEDGSELVYQSYDAEAKQLFDVFWISSPDDIWHMKYLKIDPSPPIGKFVDHISRNLEKRFEKKESFEEKPFPNLVWDGEIDLSSLQQFTPFENRPLTTLFQQTRSDGAERHGAASHFHYKMAVPLLPFLILIAITPFSMRFSRSSPFFLFAACALFGFVGFATILDGMLILGENSVLPSYLAIWGPVAVFFLLSFRPFRRSV